MYVDAVDGMRKKTSKHLTLRRRLQFLCIPCRMSTPEALSGAPSNAFRVYTQYMCTFMPGIDGNQLPSKDPPPSSHRTLKKALCLCGYDGGITLPFFSDFRAFELRKLNRVIFGSRMARFCRYIKVQLCSVCCVSTPTSTTQCVCCLRSPQLLYRTGYVGGSMVEYPFALPG